MEEENQRMEDSIKILRQHIEILSKHSSNGPVVTTRSDCALENITQSLLRGLPESSHGIQPSCSSSSVCTPLEVLPSPLPSSSLPMPDEKHGAKSVACSDILTKSPLPLPPASKDEYNMQKTINAICATVLKNLDIEK